MRSGLAWLLAAVLAVALAALLFDPAVRSPIAPVPAASATVLRQDGAAQLPLLTSGSIRAVVERARPAVVQITSEQVVLDRLGRPITAGTGVGSGVIYDAQGLILTNNHVIEGAGTLRVSLPDGRSYTGKLLGGDREMDLAVVKIEPDAGEALPIVPLGDSEALAVGDGVIASGNALGLPGGPTVTVGVVSALGRAIQEPSDTPGEPGPYLYDLIQTDAAINPGNSGGPLLNMAGEVVGINTLGASGDGNVMAQGIGFAIAVNTARPTAGQLASTGRVIHPFLGIAYGLLTPALAAQLDLPVKQGVVIGQVMASSPAARAGLRARDVIVALDGQSIVDETTLGRALSRRMPGEQVQLTVVRGTERLTLNVTLGEKPGR